MSFNLASFGKTPLTRIVDGKRFGEEILAESIWEANGLTLIYVVRRPGTA